MAGRKLTDAANHFGGVLATARWQGRIKELEKPSSPQREISGAGPTYNRQHREREGRREGGGRARSSEEAAVMAASSLLRARPPWRKARGPSRRHRSACAPRRPGGR